MDYLDAVDLQKHASWNHFLEAHSDKRLVLATTKADRLHTEFRFQQNDILLMGQESSGVPKEVSTYCINQVKIAMSRHCRSINVAVSTGIIVSEALRQTNQFPQ